MDEKQKNQTSKLLSLVLRHQPEHINLSLDQNGWAMVDELLDRLADHGEAISMDQLEEIVATNLKKRFAFNEDYTKIRANQGHSIDVELNLIPQQPPAFLFHGTIEMFIGSIQELGLQKMNRQHVHLSADIETAQKVGSRRGKPIILKIQSELMHQNGISFFLSENNVWLTDAVPAHYILFR